MAIVRCLGQHEANGLAGVVPQIVTSRAQRTMLDISQIAYVKACPRHTIDDQKPHRGFHSEVTTEALEFRKRQLPQPIPTSDSDPTTGQQV